MSLFVVWGGTTNRLFFIDEGEVEEMRFPLLRDEEGNAVRAVCDLCGSEIYEEEAFYRVNGENICDDCVADYARHLLARFREDRRE